MSNKATSEAQDPREHFLKLFMAEEHELRAMVWAMVFNASSREDVFQDIAVILWDKFDRYDQSRPFLPWARGVAIRQIRRHRRDDARDRLVLSPDAIDAVASACEQTESLAVERLSALQVCLRKLPEKSGALVRSYYVERQKGQDLAAKLDCSIDVIYQALSRLRRRLRKCIKSQMDTT
jgi:RNA polymerase sigma-70 factor (ECF subfamily)